MYNAGRLRTASRPAPPFKRARGKMVRPEAVSEPRMLGPLIREMCKPELPHAPKPLKLGCVDQRDDQFPNLVRRIDADDVVNGVAVNAFGHF